MITIRPAREGDLDGFLTLAAQVEHWFGPMVGEPGFHRAVEAHIRTGAALVAEATEPATPSAGASAPVGGLLFGADPPTYHVHWLVTAAHCRGAGVGRRLMAEAMLRYVSGPGTVEVVTFGPDHPGAVESGARAFYERLGFAPGEPTDPGPEGGSRQIYRLDVPADVRRVRRDRTADRPKPPPPGEDLGWRGLRRTTVVPEATSPRPSGAPRAPRPTPGPGSGG